MLLSTTYEIQGKKVIEQKELVTGSIVQTKHVGRDIMASFKTLFGGEIKGYTEMMEEARTEAINRMIEKAKVLGANAVIGVRLQTSTVMAGASEVIAYGTAVVLEDNNSTDN